MAVPYRSGWLVTAMHNPTYDATTNDHSAGIPPTTAADPVLDGTDHQHASAAYTQPSQLQGTTVAYSDSTGAVVPTASLQEYQLPSAVLSGYLQPVAQEGNLYAVPMAIDSMQTAASCDIRSFGGLTGCHSGAGGDGVSSAFSVVVQNSTPMYEILTEYTPPPTKPARSHEVPVEPNGYCSGDEYGFFAQDANTAVYEVPTAEGFVYSVPTSATYAIPMQDAAVYADVPVAVHSKNTESDKSSASSTHREPGIFLSLGYVFHGSQERTDAANANANAGEYEEAFDDFTTQFNWHSDQEC